jgi:hypothetical protein
MEQARTEPGRSITDRLMSRASARLPVGPRPEFFHRFAMSDPLAPAKPGAGDGAFSYLSSAAYYDEVYGTDASVPRARTMRRYASRAARAQRLSSRASSVGSPAAWAATEQAHRSSVTALALGRGVASSTRGAAVPADDWMLLARPEESDASGTGEEDARPMSAAVRRSGGATSEVVSLLQAYQRRNAVSGRELGAVARRLASVPVAKQAAVAARELRELRGPVSGGLRGDLRERAEQVSQRPAAVAAARGTASSGKGLQTVLGSSPAIARLEAPDSTWVPSRHVVENVRPVDAESGAPARVSVSGQVRDVRSQRAAGRAGPRASRPEDRTQSPAFRPAGDSARAQTLGAIAATDWASLSTQQGPARRLRPTEAVAERALSGGLSARGTGTFSAHDFSFGLRSLQERGSDSGLRAQRRISPADRSVRGHWSAPAAAPATGVLLEHGDAEPADAVQSEAPKVAHQRKKASRHEVADAGRRNASRPVSVGSSASGPGSTSLSQGSSAPVLFGRGPAADSAPLWRVERPQPHGIGGRAAQRLTRGVPSTRMASPRRLDASGAHRREELYEDRQTVADRAPQRRARPAPAYRSAEVSDSNFVRGVAPAGRGAERVQTLTGFAHAARRGQDASGALAPRAIRAPSEVPGTVLRPSVPAEGIEPTDDGTQQAAQSMAGPARRVAATGSRRSSTERHGQRPVEAALTTRSQSSSSSVPPSGAHIEGLGAGRSESSDVGPWVSDFAPSAVDGEARLSARPARRPATEHAAQRAGVASSDRTDGLGFALMSPVLAPRQASMRARLVWPHAASPAPEGSGRADRGSTRDLAGLAAGEGAVLVSVAPVEAPGVAESTEPAKQGRAVAPARSAAVKPPLGSSTATGPAAAVGAQSPVVGARGGPRDSGLAPGVSPQHVRELTTAKISPTERALARGVASVRYNARGQRQFSPLVTGHVPAAANAADTRTRSALYPRLSSQRDERGIASERTATAVAEPAQLQGHSPRASFAAAAGSVDDSRGTASSTRSDTLGVRGRLQESAERFADSESGRLGAVGAALSRGELPYEARDGGGAQVVRASALVGSVEDQVVLTVTDTGDGAVSNLGSDVPDEGRSRRGQRVRHNVSSRDKRVQGSARVEARVADVPNGKVASEVDGTSAEAERTSAEGERTSAEGERTSAEGERTSAEGERTVAVPERTVAVAERTSAEGGRTSAVAERTSTVAERAAERLSVRVQEDSVEGQLAGAEPVAARDHEEARRRSVSVSERLGARLDDAVGDPTQPGSGSQASVVERSEARRTVGRTDAPELRNAVETPETVTLAPETDAVEHVDAPVAAAKSRSRSEERAEKRAGSASTSRQAGADLGQAAGFGQGSDLTGRSVAERLGARSDSKATSDAKARGLAERTAARLAAEAGDDLELVSDAAPRLEARLAARKATGVVVPAGDGSAVDVARATGRAAERIRRELGSATAQTLLAGARDAGTADDALTAAARSTNTAGSTDRARRGGVAERTTQRVGAAPRAVLRAETVSPELKRDRPLTRVSTRDEFVPRKGLDGAVRLGGHATGYLELAAELERLEREEATPAAAPAAPWAQRAWATDPSVAAESGRASATWARRAWAQQDGPAIRHMDVDGSPAVLARADGFAETDAGVAASEAGPRRSVAVAQRAVTERLLERDQDVAASQTEARGIGRMAERGGTVAPRMGLDGERTLPRSAPGGLVEADSGQMAASQVGKQSGRQSAGSQRRAPLARAVRRAATSTRRGGHGVGLRRLAGHAAVAEGREAEVDSPASTVRGIARAAGRGVAAPEHRSVVPRMLRSSVSSLDHVLRVPVREGVASRDGDIADFGPAARGSRPSSPGRQAAERKVLGRLPPAAGSEAPDRAGSARQLDTEGFRRAPTRRPRRSRLEAGRFVAADRAEGSIRIAEPRASRTGIDRQGRIVRGQRDAATIAAPTVLSSTAWAGARDIGSDGAQAPTMRSADGRRTTTETGPSRRIRVSSNAADARVRRALSGGEAAASIQRFVDGRALQSGATTYSVGLEDLDLGGLLVQRALGRVDAAEGPVARAAGRADGSESWRGPRAEAGTDGTYRGLPRAVGLVAGAGAATEAAAAVPEGAPPRGVRRGTPVRAGRGAQTQPRQGRQTGVRAAARAAGRVADRRDGQQERLGLNQTWRYLAEPVEAPTDPGETGPVGSASPRSASPRSAIGIAPGLGGLGVAEGQTADGRNPQAPGWARRASEEPAGLQARGERAEPGEGLRRSGGLLTALARATRPEDIVRVIVQESAQMRSIIGELPGPAARLVERISAATVNADEGSRSLVGAADRGATVPSSRTRTVRRDVLTPVRVHGGKSRTGTSASSQGVGSSNVMKLSSKLMKLIHLAEADRRRDEARKHVRMAEDSASARAEGGQSAGLGEAGESNVNLKALQQEVLDAVMRALELIQARREDPDGRSIWW